MKRKLMAALLALIMVVSIVPMSVFAAEDEAVAQIGDVTYTTLAAAVEAAETGATIELLANTTGSGIQVAAGKNLTIDLGGYKYTINDPAVGSTNTQTQGFQLLALPDRTNPGTMTIKNGTINAAEGNQKIKFLIQNYVDLTLENVTLDGTNLAKPGTDSNGNPQYNYVLSNNNGDVAIVGNSSIIAPKGGVAFDVYDYSAGGYKGVNVVVNTTGTIDGNIEVYNCNQFTNNEELSYAFLWIYAGNFTGKITETGVVYSSPAPYGSSAVRILGGIFDVRPSDRHRYYDYDSAESFKEINGKYVLTLPENAVASVGEVNFASLEDAYNAAPAGETITLLKDAIGGGIKITKSVAIDFAGHTYTVGAPTVGSTGTETLAFQIRSESEEVVFKNGTIEVENYEKMKVVIMNYTNLTLEDMTIDGTGSDAMQFVMSCNNGNTVIKGNTSIIAPSTTELALDVDGSQSSYGAVNVSINTTGKITGYVDIYGEEATVEITAGTFEGAVNKAEDASTLTITGGTFDVDPSDYVADGYYSYKTGEKYVVKVMPTETPDEGEDEGEHSVATNEVTTDVVISETVVIPESSTVTEQDIANTAGSVSSSTLPELEAMPETFPENTTSLQGFVNTTASDIVTDEVVDEAAEELNVTADELTIVVVPSLEVEVKSYKEEPTTLEDGTEGTIKTLEFDIEPKYDVVAIDNNNNDNTATLKEDQELEVTEPVVITMELPEGFAPVGSTLYIEHVKDDGTTYIYEGKVSQDASGNLILTFVNPNGFSTFRITTRNTAVASVDGVGYNDIYTALAVANGKTITLLQNVGDIVIDEPVSFTLNKNGCTVGSITAEDGLVMNVTGDHYLVVRNAQIFPKLFNVKVSATEGGKVNVAKNFYIALGASRTIKITPADGYEVANVLVNGKSVGAVEKYSIRGARMNYKIQVVFKEIDE